MFRLGLRRGLGSLGAASIAAVVQHSHAQGVPEESPVATQWLWSHGGIQLRRDAQGDALFVDEATGAQLKTRPDSFPAEAYAQRWRVPAAKPVKERARVARHIFLVRHSQYHMQSKEDTQRTLTPMGRQQAEFLAQRLAKVHAAQEGHYAQFALSTLISSELVRAKETADLLALGLPTAKRSRDGDLNEGRPCLPEPAPRHAHHYTNANGDAERIERAAQKLRSPPPVSQLADSHEVVVCHANVIRYVVCRALVRALSRLRERPCVRSHEHACE